ncbi:MAG: hypothetical protein R6V29_09945 [Spirochaetia bacterium]
MEISSRACTGKRDAREVELINEQADELNNEALDVLAFQADE